MDSSHTHTLCQQPHWSEVKGASEGIPCTDWIPWYFGTVRSLFSLGHNDDASRAPSVCTANLAGRRFTVHFPDRRPQIWLADKQCEDPTECSQPRVAYISRNQVARMWPQSVGQYLHAILGWARERVRQTAIPHPVMSIISLFIGSQKSKVDKNRNCGG